MARATILYQLYELTGKDEVPNQEQERRKGVMCTVSKRWSRQSARLNALDPPCAGIARIEDRFAKFEEEVLNDLIVLSEDRFWWWYCPVLEI